MKASMKGSGWHSQALRLSPNLSNRNGDIYFSLCTTCMYTWLESRGIKASFLHEKAPVTARRWLTHGRRLIMISGTRKGIAI